MDRWRQHKATAPQRGGFSGLNSFLLTMRTMMAGHTSPFWMTVPQANAQGARIRKGEKSSVVVYYGQGRTQRDEIEDTNDTNSGDVSTFRFQKSYRVLNADQIEGLTEGFQPDPAPVPDHPPHKPIPHMQNFLDAIDITTVFTGTEAYYRPTLDKVFMPDIVRF